MRDCSWIPNKFENARPDGLRCTSDRTNNLPYGGYNCIAWAAGRTSQWWWPFDDPSAHWPIAVDSNDPTNPEQFVRAFALAGYSRCRNGRFRHGFEKVAFYVNASGGVEHAARLLPNRAWTSKLGQAEDIEHDFLEDLEGKVYGKAKIFVQRKNLDFVETNLLLRIWAWLLSFWV